MKMSELDCESYKTLQDEISNRLQSHKNKSRSTYSAGVWVAAMLLILFSIAVIAFISDCNVECFLTPCEIIGEIQIGIGSVLLGKVIAISIIGLTCLVVLGFQFLKWWDNKMKHEKICCDMEKYYSDKCFKYENEIREMLAKNEAINHIE